MRNLVLPLALATVVACSRTSTISGTESGVTAAESVSASSEGAPTVRPVYPLDASAPDPLATHLCTALHEVPAKRRAECCSATPGVLVTSECVRMLSAALHFDAVSVDPVKVDACIQGIETTYAGCDWVGPNTPQPPEACEGTLVVGKLGVGALCRSSLECAAGLRCQGVGPTQPGTCGAPKDDGAPCGGTVDPLAVYVRQNHFESTHPECKGWCNRRVCAAPVERGTPCSPQTRCAEGLACVDGKCGNPRPATPVVRRPAGATCKADAECLGGCVNGTCGMKCP
jgi:hypothetical protein